MNGEDKEFIDYGLIDFNEDYDDLKEKERDEEEKWFDEEISETKCD